jgi:hypothetical protein
LSAFRSKLEELAIVRNTQRERKPKIAPDSCPAIEHSTLLKKFKCSCDPVAVPLLEMHIRKNVSEKMFRREPGDGETAALSHCVILVQFYWRALRSDGSGRPVAARGDNERAFTFVHNSLIASWRFRSCAWIAGWSREENTRQI